MSNRSSVVTTASEPVAPRRAGHPRLWVIVLAALVGAAACGGDDDAQVASPVPEAATPVPTVVVEDPTPAPTPTVEAGTDPSPDDSTADAVVNADPVLVDLDDFKITTATTTYKAGILNFEVTNGDDIPHEFGIARGAGYEELPKLADGSIDETALGDDFLGKTAVVDAVLSPVREISYTLEPGAYVLFCNLVVGPVSHAARGQVLSVTVVD